MSVADKVCIVLTTSEHSTLQTIVTLQSIISNCTKEMEVFVLLKGDFSSMMKYTPLLEEKGKCTINFIDISAHTSVFKDVLGVDLDKIDDDTLCRLAMFKIMPSHVNKCVVLNSDMVVSFDVSNHIGSMNDDDFLMAVVDSFSMEHRNTTLSHIKKSPMFEQMAGNPKNYPYFNAGFLIVNLEKCTRNNIFDQLISLLQSNLPRPYGYQDLMNALFGQKYRDDVVYLPPEYNVFCASTIDHSKGHGNGYYTREQTIAAYQNPKVYHYAGPEKPWFYPICQYYDVWWHYAELSPVKSELLDLVSKKWSSEVKLHINTIRERDALRDAAQSDVVLTKYRRDANSSPDVSVVMTGDCNYVLQLTVTATSILENITRDKFVMFYILEESFTDADKKRISLLTLKYNCEIRFIDVSDHMYLFESADTSTFSNKHVSMACYYRLLILSLLPDDVTDCFYIDGDMAISTDIWSLREEIKDSLFAAVVESFAMENRADVLRHLKSIPEFSKFNDNPTSYPYFNAGFFFMNIKKCREIDVQSQLLALFNKHVNLPFADQDLLNALFGQKYRDDVVYLPPEYNVFCASTIDHSKGHGNGYYTREQTIAAYQNPKVYHYAGPEKPWFYPICQYYDVWWHYAELSPVKSELLDLVSKKWSSEVKLHIETLNKLNNVNKTESFKKKVYSLLTKKQGVQERYLRYIQEHPDTSTPFRLVKLIGFNISSPKENKQQLETDEIKIKQAIDNHKVVSFDVFDTLICRPVADPLDILRYIDNHESPGFFKARIDADVRARQKHPDKQDVTLDEIYAEIDKKYANLKELEIREEIWSVNRNEKLFNLYNYALRKKKKLYFISDMYLSEDTIRAMLSKCGYAEYDLILSSSTGKLKSTGDAFKLLLEKETAPPKEIVHIGDNLQSDYNNAIRNGLDAILVESNICTLMKLPYIEKFHNNNMTESKSYLLGILSTFRYDYGIDYWYDLGVKLAGPIVYGYVSWLESELTKDSIKTLALIARDGYLLKKAIELLYPGKFDTHYVYAPRRVSNLCNQDFDLKYSFGEWTSEFADSIYENYLDQLDSEICWNKLSLGDKFDYIKKNLDVVKSVANKKRHDYSIYFNSIVKDSKVALIDSTTTFFSSQQLVQSVYHGDLYGYYWVINSHVNVDGIDYSKVKTYMVERGNKIKEWDIMEFILTSPEPPVVDVTPDKGPVYKSANEFDNVRSKIFESIAKGAMDFVKRCVDLNITTRFNLPPAVITEYINTWIDTATPEDQKMFEDMRLPVRCEHDQYVPVIKSWRS